MPRDNDQDGTPQGVFGAELRYYRERAGLSQTELAALVNVSHDVISKIETGERPPAKDFPERLDAVPELDSRGGLTRLWGNLRKGLRHRAIPGGSSHGLTLRLRRPRCGRTSHCWFRVCSRPRTTHGRSSPPAPAATMTTWTTR